MDSSDEDIYITQNSFSCESQVLSEIEVDVLDYVLSGEVSRVQSLAETQLKAKELEEAKSSKDNTFRGISLVGDEKLEKRKETRTPKSTKINTNWTVRTWTKWAKE